MISNNLREFSNVRSNLCTLAYCAIQNMIIGNADLVTEQIIELHNCAERFISADLPRHYDVFKKIISEDVEELDRILERDTKKARSLGYLAA